jgi:hypothetical protein
MASGTQLVDVVYVTPRQPGKASFKYVPKPKSYTGINVSHAPAIEELLLQFQPEGKRFLNKSNTSAFYFRKDDKGAFFICPSPTGNVFRHSGDEMTRSTVASVNSALGTRVAKIVFVANTWHEDVVKEMEKHFKIHKLDARNGWYSTDRITKGVDDSLVKRTFTINCELMVRAPSLSSS